MHEIKSENEEEHILNKNDIFKKTPKFLENKQQTKNKNLII
jgi:hypothetical protein